MSFKFPDLSSLQQQLQQTSQQLSQQFQTGIEQVTKEANSFNDNLQPFLKRTQRLAQERLGGLNDISELPKEYIELEKKVDNLKKFYTKVLDITEQYNLESYDYPPHLKENFQEVTKSLTEKLQSLSQASTTAEAEAILSGSSADGNKKTTIPKTFHHQFGKTLNGSKDAFSEEGVEEEESYSLVKALQKMSEVEFKLGDERLQQDKQIIVDFNNKVKNILSTQFSITNNYRRNVENARITFDVLRSEAKQFDNNNTTEGDATETATTTVPESLQAKLDSAEDDLVNATEIAVESMKKLIIPTEPINLLKVYNKIQLKYHKNAVTMLSELEKELEAIPVDEDAE